MFDSDGPITIAGPMLIQNGIAGLRGIMITQAEDRFMPWAGLSLPQGASVWSDGVGEDALTALLPGDDVKGGVSLTTREMSGSKIAFGSLSEEIHVP